MALIFCATYINSPLKNGLEGKGVSHLNVTLHFDRVQEDLCLLEDGQLAVVQNIPH